MLVCHSREEFYRHLTTLYFYAVNERICCPDGDARYLLSASIGGCAGGRHGLRNERKNCVSQGQRELIYYCCINACIKMFSSQFSIRKSSGSMRAADSP